MSEPKPKTALMVGGPADGRWVVTQDRTIRVPELATIDWAAALSETSDLEMHDYFVQTFVMLGFALDVAICERTFMESDERNRAIIRALMQRDVASAMLGDR